jgi:hypothetical protein
MISFGRLELGRRIPAAAFTTGWAEPIGFATVRAADVIETSGVVDQAVPHHDALFLLAPIPTRDVCPLSTQDLILHRWQSDHPLGMSAYLLPDGSILRGAREQPPKNFRQPGGSGGRVQLIAWDGTVLWGFLYAGDRFFSHHDIHPMPNGNVLLTAWEHKRPDEAFAAGRVPSKPVEGGVRADSVVEVQPVGAEGDRSGQGGDRLYRWGNPAASPWAEPVPSPPPIGPRRAAVPGSQPNPQSRNAASTGRRASPFSVNT